MRTKEEKKAYNRLYNQTYREANREKLKAKSQISNQTRREEHRVYYRKQRQALKLEALRILGNQCACPGCDTSEPHFLTIDHINGRPKGSRRNALYVARDSGWDKTKFQMLCANCNFAKSDRGFCPVHQTDPGQRNGHSPGANAQIGFSILDREGGDTP